MNISNNEYPPRSLIFSKSSASTTNVLSSIVIVVRLSRLCGALQKKKQRILKLVSHYSIEYSCNSNENTDVIYVGAGSASSFTCILRLGLLRLIFCPLRLLKSHLLLGIVPKY